MIITSILYIVKKFCTSLRENVTNVTSFEKKMLLLTKKERNGIRMWEHVPFVEKYSPKKISKDKNYQKVKDHCQFTGNYRSAALSIYNLKFNVLQKIL